MEKNRKPMENDRVTKGGTYENHSETHRKRAENNRKTMETHRKTENHGESKETHRKTTRKTVGNLKREQESPMERHRKTDGNP